MVLPALTVALISCGLVLLEALLPILQGFLQQKFRPQVLKEQLGNKAQELKEMAKELATISPQDEFAQHARLSRQKIKVQAEFETLVVQKSAEDAKVAASLANVKRALVMVVHSVLFLTYRSEPMFFLPASALSPASWLFAFPGHAAGTIGYILWTAVCRGATQALLGAMA
eukprot:comp19664_c0_seq1/m.23287 comp19664_c0_seq1/g.23287  ORF comp19664_c0_seq1/g.23287 comp19664_c0_seq1/m.23287 type:complete len:171 (-) comp19664_c0_seq1:114-626(-)